MYVHMYIHTYIHTYNVRTCKKMAYVMQCFLQTLQVHKTGVTHFFSMDEARQDFGYAPSEHNLDDIVEWFKARGHSRVQRSLKSSSCNWVTLIVLISISLLFLFLQTLFM